MQLVGTGGFTDVTITYSTPRGDDLDTRLLRAMVIKGILEQITTATVNLVNADLLAKNRGLRIVESKVPSSGTVRPWLRCWPVCPTSIGTRARAWQMCPLTLRLAGHQQQQIGAQAVSLPHGVCMNA